MSEERDSAGLCLFKAPAVLSNVIEYTHYYRMIGWRMGECSSDKYLFYFSNNNKINKLLNAWMKINKVEIHFSPEILSSVVGALHFLMRFFFSMTYCFTAASNASVIFYFWKNPIKSASFKVQTIVLSYFLWNKSNFRNYFLVFISTLAPSFIIHLSIFTTSHLNSLAIRLL